MAKGKWRDKYTQRALEEGYKARSIFKIQAINKKYSILKAYYRALDLGGWPGSWTQFLSKNVKEVITIDIKPFDKDIRSLPNVETIQGDVFDKSTFRDIPGKFDLIVSDMAPNTTGIKIIDQGASLDLVMQSLNIVKGFLKENGNFVFKIFQGPDSDLSIVEAKKYFSFVKTTKPKGSRKTSKEMFVVCKYFHPSGIRGQMNKKNIFTDEDSDNDEDL